MDKYEYKVRSEEIRNLIARGEYADAAEIADMIDWRRVKSVMMLCTISDLYKINRRFEDSKNILLLAYDRHPTSRSILYSLCELSIKMGEFVQAIEYYKEFVQAAPQDTGRYILQYKLYVAQEVSLEERIEVLEEFKKRDYREKWAYELAYLYHRVGLATRCVEECDELILWFGEGKYVTKAMELKMLHQPLTPEQQAKYEGRFEEFCRQQEAQQNQGGIPEDEDNPRDVLSAPTVEITNGELEDIQVKTDVGQYNTINLQAALADSMKELWDGQGQPEGTKVATEEYFSETGAEEPIPVTEEGTPSEEEKAGDEELTMTQEISQAIFESHSQFTEDTTEVVMPEEKTGAGETAENVSQQVLDDMKEEVTEQPAETKETEHPVLQRPEVFDKYIGMDYDGQMSFVIPETEQVEKQITGQLNLKDIMAEWEKVKKEDEKKREEEVRQRVLEHTGSILFDFDEAVKDGLLEKLENNEDVPGIVDAPEDADDFETFGEADEGEETEAGEEIEIPEEMAEEVSEEDNPEETDEVEELVEVEETEDSETEEPEEEEESDSDEEEVTEPDVNTETVEQPEETETEEEEKQPENPEHDGEPEEIQKEEPCEEKEKTDEENREEIIEEAVRSLTPEETEIFASVIQNKKTKAQLIKTLDTITLASYTGNVIITGEEGMDTLKLAKNLMKEVKMMDGNFSGKVAKISGSSLNKKEMNQILEKLNNGALIIEKIKEMTKETAEKLYKALQQENLGIVVILEGTKKSVSRLLEEVPDLKECFNARIDMQALDNDSLVAFGKNYAREQEYSIDEMGLLALHTKISDHQTSDHSVTTFEVKEMIDDAIDHANRKTMGHFFDVLFAKRYDEEDMIVLRENDFI